MECGFVFVAGFCGLAVKGREGVTARFGGVLGIDVVEASEAKTITNDQHS